MGRHCCRDLEMGSLMLTIASPNTDRSLLTTAELRGAAGVGDNSRDAELIPLGRYVSAMITKACRVSAAAGIPPTLRSEAVVETFRIGCKQGSVVLSRRPVTEISAVSEDGEDLADGDYEIDGSGILYRLSSNVRSEWLRAEVSVSYTAGWATVPDDLKYAAIKFVRAELTTGSRDPLLKRLKVDGISEREWWVEPTKDTVVPSDVLDILRRGGYVNLSTSFA